MKSTSAILVAFLATCVCGFDVEIGSTNEDKYGIMGVVSPDPIRCSSESGNFTKMEMTSCTSQPCTMRPSTSYEISVTFIPSRTTVSLRRDIEYFNNMSQRTVLASDIFHETFLPSMSYRVDAQALIPQSMSGTNGEIRVYLYDMQGYFVARCFQGLVA